MAVCSQDTMPPARFPPNSLRKPKHDKWGGLSHLLFLSLSHKSVTHTKTQQSTRTRGPLGKLLWKAIILSNSLCPSLEEAVLSQPTDVSLTWDLLQLVVPLLSRRAMSCCFAVQLSSLSHEIRKTPDREPRHQPGSQQHEMGALLPPDAQMGSASEKPNLCCQC